MLAKIWERLRGYDKWIETEATVQSSQVRAKSHVGRDGSVSYTYDSGVDLIWTDAQGQRRSAAFAVDDQSPLYQLVGGESVTVRYDPGRPDRFYFRELLFSRVNFCIRMALYVLLLAGFLLLLISLNIYTHTHH